MSRIIIPQRRILARQPQRPVEIDLAHPAIAGNAVLLDYVAPISSVNKIGTVGLAVNLAGVASYCSGSGSRIDLGTNCSPSTRNCTVMVVFRAIALASASRLLVTHSVSSTSGIYLGVTTAGAVELTSGDGTGTTTANSRSLTTDDGAVVAGREYTVVAGFTSATTGYIYINGVAKALTPSGTAENYATGYGNGLLHAYYNGNAFYYGNQEINACVVLENVAAESVAKKLSDNPWQIFRRRTRRTIIDFGGSGLSSVYADSALSYYVRAMLSSDSGITYAIRNAIYKDDAVGYFLRSAIAQNSEVGYVLRSAIAKDDAEAYKIRGLVQASDAEAYSIRGLVQTSDGEAYKIRGQVQADASTSYDIQSSTSVASSNAVNYSVRGSVAASAPSGYSVRGSAQRDAASAYSVRSAASRDVVASYAVSASASSVYADSTVSYSVDGVVPSCPSAESIAAATVAALQAIFLPVDAQKMNGSEIIGDGSEINPWRGVGVSP